MFPKAPSQPHSLFPPRVQRSIFLISHAGAPGLGKEHGRSPRPTLTKCVEPTNRKSCYKLTVLCYLAVVTREIIRTMIPHIKPPTDTLVHVRLSTSTFKSLKRGMTDASQKDTDGPPQGLPGDSRVP